jgi:tetratricopeptide (TPR) repeat protein
MAGTGSSAAEALNAEGNARYAAGRFADALSSYRGAAQADGSVSKYHSNQANSLMQLGQPEAALEAAEAAIAADPSWLKGHFFKVLALEAQGRLEEAVGACIAGDAIVAGDAAPLRDARARLEQALRRRRALERLEQQRAEERAAAERRAAAHEAAAAAAAAAVQQQQQQQQPQQQHQQQQSSAASAPARAWAAAAQPTVAVTYSAKVRDDSGNVRSFSFEHRLDAARVRRAATDRQEGVAILRAVTMPHYQEMLAAAPWRCVSCVTAPATKLLLHPMSYLHLSPPKVLDAGVTPVSAQAACAAAAEAMTQSIMAQAGISGRANAGVATGRW